MRDTAITSRCSDTSYLLFPYYVYGIVLYRYSPLRCPAPLVRAGVAHGRRSAASCLKRRAVGSMLPSRIVLRVIVNTLPAKAIRRRLPVRHTAFPHCLIHILSLRSSAVESQASEPDRQLCFSQATMPMHSLCVGLPYLLPLLPGLLRLTKIIQLPCLN